MTRTTLTFAEALSFRRASTADYVDASGSTVTAAVDEARFDHDPTSHAVLGLKIEGAIEAGAPDVAAVADDSWVTAGRHTVLHQYLEPDTAAVVRDCHFTDDPEALIDGLLRIKATHQLIAGFAFPPTDIADVDANPPALTRDGDAVTWIKDVSVSWTVASATRVTTDAETRVTADGDIRITGDPA